MRPEKGVRLAACVGLLFRIGGRLSCRFLPQAGTLRGERLGFTHTQECVAMKWIGLWAILWAAVCVSGCITVKAPEEINVNGPVPADGSKEDWKAYGKSYYE